MLVRYSRSPVLLHADSDVVHRISMHRRIREYGSGRFVRSDSDYIPVELSRDDIQIAERYALFMRHEAIAKGFKPKGMGDISTHTTGMYGEIAVSRYLGIDIPDIGYRNARKRGYDIGGWEVRTRSVEHGVLGLNADNSGWFILARSHDFPVIWLVGWIHSSEGFDVAQPRNNNDFTWYGVAEHHLHPLPAVNILHSSDV